MNFQNIKFTKKNLLIISVFVLAVIFLISIILVAKRTNDAITATNSYEDCVIAGGTLLESYPEQCTIYGKTFTHKIDTSVQPPDQSYYGSSTDAACNLDSDCRVSGCNTEICQGTTEENQVSICIAPSQSTPKDLGYSCGCKQQKCQWNK